jgi:hypothetical protein
VEVRVFSTAPLIKIIIKSDAYTFIAAGFVSRVLWKSTDEIGLLSTNAQKLPGSSYFFAVQTKDDIFINNAAIAITLTGC